MLRAILVDDEDLSVRMLESIVDWRRYGVEITATARSGKDALRLFSELRPELMVTDIRMPGMDGIELLRCVKEMEPRTEFILVSAYADFEYAKEAIALGSAYYLLKPVDEFELERAIKKNRRQDRRPAGDTTPAGEYPQAKGASDAVQLYAHRCGQSRGTEKCGTPERVLRAICADWVYAE